MFFLKSTPSVIFYKTLKINNLKDEILKRLAQKAPRRHHRILIVLGHQPSKDGSITKTCFSQWWQSDFTVEGIVYRTAEHWMMAEKARLFNDETVLAEILAVEKPAAAKALGRKVKDFDPSVWDGKKREIVVQGNLHKFAQNAELKAFLRTTGDKIIVEASPVDRIWGISLAPDNPLALNPATWRGQNLLGFALMEVRDLLK